MRGWQGQPRKIVECEHHEANTGTNSSENDDCWAVGGLQFGGAENDLLAIRLQSSNTLFSAARTSNS
jgi:hypothetical protein